MTPKYGVGYLFLFTFFLFIQVCIFFSILFIQVCFVFFPILFMYSSLFFLSLTDNNSDNNHTYQGINDTIIIPTT